MRCEAKSPWSAPATSARRPRSTRAKGYADVVLVDIVEGMPQGKALDLDGSRAGDRLRRRR